MQILNEQIRERAGDKAGSPYQSDRDFCQARRKAEHFSLWMAARWGLFGGAVLWIASQWPA